MKSADLQRIFLALTLPSHVQGSLSALGKRLHDSGVAASWERTEKMHITLRFLGAIDSATRQEAETRVARIAESTSEIDLVFHSLGAFPSPERPRVIWAGALPTAPLIGLMRQLESVSRECGLEPEQRRPHPHCTLGRVKAAHKNVNLTALIKSITFDPILTRASGVTLLKSVLHQGGSTYTTIQSYPFIRTRGTHD